MKLWWCAAGWLWCAAWSASCGSVAPAPATAPATASTAPSVPVADAGVSDAAADSGALAADSGWPSSAAVVDAGPPVRPPPEHPASFSRPALCDRADGRDDQVRTALCAQPAPLIAGLGDLEYVLGLQPPKVAGTIYGGAVVLAHSTSLSGALVSEINPRTIITTPKLFVAFTRGIQQVEIAAMDKVAAPRFNYYAVDFRQACNAAAGGCRPGDLYTPSIEADWQSFSLADDEDLKNTPSDCRQCHQRGSDKPALLMRELDGPWTHFFGPDQDDSQGFPEATGTGLLHDYLQAKGDEVYANLASLVMRSTVGFTLQNLVTRPQPLLFDGSQILNERWPYQDGGYAATPEKSKTWYDAYEAFKRGEQLPLPYFDPRVTDKAKLQQLTAAYQRFARGEAPASELPDLADIFPDDPQTRAEIGLQTEPNATPAQTLIQACGTCHNDVLDQSITRARFNVALSHMSRAQVELAIARMQLPLDMQGAMPPKGRRTIAAGQLKPLIEYLRQDKRSTEDESMLNHAAQMGMAGPGNLMMGPGL